METVVFVVRSIFIAAVFFVIAAVAEGLIRKKTGSRKPVLTTRKCTMVGVFSAISGLLMMIEIPLPFAPFFYKLDISEVPILILSFAYGPVAGVLGEFLKELIKLLFTGTGSAFVGEVANFVIGCSFVLPAGLIYLMHKTRKQAGIACGIGTLVMTVFGSFLNAVWLLPAFAEIYGLPLDSIVALGTEINPEIDSVRTLVLCCVVPMNLLKGVVDSFLCGLLYKRLSPLMKKTEGRG